jgi:hypothetical protein
MFFPTPSFHHVLPKLIDLNPPCFEALCGPTAILQSIASKQFAWVGLHFEYNG